MPAHTFNSLLHESKSYARTRVLFFAVQPLEHLKNALVLTRIDPDPLILHPDADPVDIAALGANP